MANKFTNDPYGFPDPLADNKTKNSKEYIVAYNRAIYNSFNRYGIRFLYNDRVKYRNHANYYLGKMLMDRYKKRMASFNEEEPGKESFLNINWLPINLAYKFVNIIVDKVVSTGYDVELEAIDPIALDARKDMESTMRAIMDNKAWLEQMQIDLNPQKLGFDPAILPDHSDELQLHIEMSEKDEFAMEGEMAINLHFTNNDFEQVRKEYIRDGVLYSPMMVETRNDKYGNTKIKRISPEYGVIANSRSEDFKDAPWGGYIEYMSFEELQASAGESFTMKEYDDIYCNFSSSLISTDTVLGLTPFQNKTDGDRKVAVMKSYYKTNIQNTYVKKKDSRGNNRLYKTDKQNKKEKDGQEVLRDTYEVVYESRWIIGSEYIYEYGIMNDLEVDKNNPCATRIPLHVIYPNMLDGMSTSVFETCLPIFDEINVAWFQFQHLMASIIPDGVAIDQDALADIALGGAGKKSSPKEIMDLFFKKGILLYSSRGLDGGKTHLPVQNLMNNTHEKAERQLGTVFSLINVLRQLTGMNEGVDASTPSANALVGTMEIAYQGALSAIGHLFSADRLMVKHVAESCISLTQAAIRRGEISGYINSIGIGSVKFWQVNKSITARQYGMRIVVRPTQAEWGDLYAHAGAALEKGILNYSEYSIIREMSNLKQARKYMAIVEKRKAREAQAQQQAMMQQQGELNQQTALAAEQAKQQTLQLEYQLKGGLEQAIAQRNIAEIHAKYGYELQIQQMMLQQKASDAEVQARTKILDGAAKNQTAMEVARLQSETALEVAEEREERTKKTDK